MTPLTTVLAGGVGASKLLLGLSKVIDPSSITVIGNSGDDVVVHGLSISPDLDIVMYTLAGLVNPATGWGLEGDTFHFLRGLERLGEEVWFNLGDRDLATHILRTKLLRLGLRPTEIALELGRRLGLSTRVIPPTDELIRTEVETPVGWLGFQEYFVREKCVPDILDVAFRGAERAHATDEALEAIATAERIIIAPSNPIASIGPILAVPGIREALKSTSAKRIAVSPLVGGRSLKGPSDRMMKSLGFQADALGVAKYYDGLIDSIVIDTLDNLLADKIASTGIKVHVNDTVMKSDEDKIRLAAILLKITNTK